MPNGDRAHEHPLTLVSNLESRTSGAQPLPASQQPTMSRSRNARERSASIPRWRMPSTPASQRGSKQRPSHMGFQRMPEDCTLMQQATTIASVRCLPRPPHLDGGVGRRRHKAVLADQRNVVDLRACHTLSIQLVPSSARLLESNREYQGMFPRCLQAGTKRSVARVCSYPIGVRFKCCAPTRIGTISVVPPADCPISSGVEQVTSAPRCRIFVKQQRSDTRAVLQEFEKQFRGVEGR